MSNEMTTRKSNHEEASGDDQDFGKSFLDRYPPGPADDAQDYAYLMVAAKLNLLLPTEEIREGRRVWREASHRYSLSEYPPGPREHIGAYGLLFKFADQGLVRPTNQIRDGRRLWVRVEARKLN